MKHFQLGTLSAGVSGFLIAFLVIWGGLAPYAIPYVVFAVPCVAAFRKEPRAIWRPLTIGSAIFAVCLSFYFAHAFSREIDGVRVLGFPLPYLPGEPAFGPDMRVIVNHTLIAGLCLFPLSVASTIHTIRRTRSTRN